MKKNYVLRTLLGAPIGLSISYVITIIISAIINNGEFYPVVPQLTHLCGNEINAVIIQAICSLIYGAVFSGASIIWEIDRFSLLKQTIIHYIVISVTSLPIAYLMHWMHHSAWGVISYFSIFIIIYIIIWVSQYLAMKKRIKLFNKKMMTDINN